MKVHYAAEGTEPRECDYDDYFVDEHKAVYQRLNPRVHQDSWRRLAHSDIKELKIPLEPKLTDHDKYYLMQSLGLDPGTEIE